MKNNHLSRVGGVAAAARMPCSTGRKHLFETTLMATFVPAPVLVLYKIK